MLNWAVFFLCFFVSVFLCFFVSVILCFFVCFFVCLFVCLFLSLLLQGAHVDCVESSCVLGLYLVFQVSPPRVDYRDSHISIVTLYT